MSTALKDIHGNIVGFASNDKALEMREARKHALAVNLDKTIEDKKYDLEITRNTRQRRILLTELVHCLDMRAHYPYPRPVSSFDRPDEEYRAEKQKVNQEYYDQKIADYIAQGKHLKAKSFQKLVETIKSQERGERSNRSVWISEVKLVSGR